MPEQTDDLYPNDSTFLGGVPLEPHEQTVARKKEKAQTLQVLPVLKDVVKKLEEKIEFFGSVDAMPASLKTKPTKFMNQHNANELTRNNLREIKEWIEDLLDAHAKNK